MCCIVLLGRTACLSSCGALQLFVDLAVVEQFAVIDQAKTAVSGWLKGALLCCL